MHKKLILFALVFIFKSITISAQEKKWSLYSNNMLGIGELSTSMSAVYNDQFYADFLLGYSVSVNFVRRRNQSLLIHSPWANVKVGWLFLNWTNPYTGFYLELNRPLNNWSYTDSEGWRKSRENVLVGVLGFRNDIKNTSLTYDVKLGAEKYDFYPETDFYSIRPYVRLRIGYSILMK